MSGAACSSCPSEIETIAAAATSAASTAYPATRRVPLRVGSPAAACAVAASTRLRVGDPELRRKGRAALGGGTRWSDPRATRMLARMAANRELEPGDTLGGYRLESLLGEG